MTYVSRRTRIIYSRWLDECDAEYRLQASRKRSDGRLKKYSSCDDFRAWVNDNCIKHDHLADLMSSNEFPGHPPFRLFGRFIPVPVLFQLAQGSKTTAENQSIEEGKQSARRTQSKISKDYKSETGRDNKSETGRDYYGDTGGETGGINNPNRRGINGADNNNVPGVGSNSSLLRAQWEQNLLEKSLVDCTTLLDRAMKKLEKIDSIVAQVNEEGDNCGTENIHESLHKSKLSCSCSANSSSCDVLNSKNQKAQEAAKCSELLRRISDLRVKLKRIQECRREVNHQIISSKKKIECAPAVQVTELYSRQEESHIKKLQKKLEKLIAERGRLLTEMCEALTSLNNIKKLSNSTMGFPRGDSKSRRSSNEFGSKFGESVICHCGCQCSDFQDSEDSVKFHCSESYSSDTDNTGAKSQAEGYYYVTPCSQSFNTGNEATDFNGNFPNPIGQNGEETVNRTSLQQTPGNTYQKRNANMDEKGTGGNAQNVARSSSKQSHQKVEKGARAQNQDVENSVGGQNQKLENGATAQNQRRPQTPRSSRGSKVENEKEKKVEDKKGKVKFVCPKSPCREFLDADDISAYKNTLTQEQLCIVYEAVESIRRSWQKTPATTQTAAARESQETQARPGSQGRPGTPGTPGRPGTPRALESQGRPGTPRTLEAQGRPGAQRTPEARGRPESPGICDTQRTPGPPNTPEVQGRPGSQGRSGAQRTPEARRRPESPGICDTQRTPGPPVITRKGRESVSLDRDPQSQNYRGRTKSGTILERRAKSETTMKEIEKTLRNYQRRLSEMDNLECKVEQLKEKVSESNYLKKNLAKMRAESRAREADREKSEKEITRLSTENWELKRKIQDLAAKFTSQAKKIQSLKCGVRRARELECQAEDMKKELSEYRDSFEHQRKCISKWESVVLVQRTEIENLMNHIRMLTTQLKEEQGGIPSRDKKTMQRSRSYSPEAVKGKKTPIRPKTQLRNFRRPEEDGGCICGNLHPESSYPEDGGRNQQSNFEGGYDSNEWCN